jgi:hypothetical protein
VKAKIKEAGGPSLDILNNHRYWTTERRTVEIRPDPPHSAKVRLVAI